MNLILPAFYNQTVNTYVPDGRTGINLVERLSWDEIGLATGVYPEHNELALKHIQYAVGYLPKPYIYMPHITFMQTLIEQYYSGVISAEQFTDGMYRSAQAIRNDDMRKNGWVDNRMFNDWHHEEYQTSSALYKDAARERLSHFMSYEPALEHSLQAEIYLRQLFERDNFYHRMPYCDVDIRAVTIVRYREAFLIEGEAVADDSDLIGVHYHKVMREHETWLAGSLVRLPV